MNCWRKSGLEADGVKLEDEFKVAPPSGMTTEQFNAWFDVDRDVPRGEELTFEDGERELIIDRW